MLRSLLASVVVAVIINCPAHSAPVGIGFVQAEEGTWWCRAAGPAEALACAGKKCAAEGHGQDCHATRWCYPAGWSATMVVWLSEFHSTVPLCGAPTAESVTETLRAICAGFDDGHRCDLTRVIDPEGKEVEVDDIVWPGRVLVPGESGAPSDRQPAANP